MNPYSQQSSFRRPKQPRVMPLAGSPDFNKYQERAGKLRQLLHEQHVEAARYRPWIKEAETALGDDAPYEAYRTFFLTRCAEYIQEYGFFIEYRFVRPVSLALAIVTPEPRTVSLPPVILLPATTCKALVPVAPAAVLESSPQPRPMIEAVQTYQPEPTPDQILYTNSNLLKLGAAQRELFTVAVTNYLDYLVLTATGQHVEQPLVASDLALMRLAKALGGNVPPTPIKQSRTD